MLLIFDMNYKAATRSPAFEGEWASLEVNLKEFLRAKGLEQVQTWAHLVPKSTEQAGLAADFLYDLLRGLGASGPEAERWHDPARALWKHASLDKCGLAKRAGELSGLHLSADALDRQLASSSRQEAEDLRKLHAASLAQLPTEWRGKRYRRQQKLSNEAERAEEEAAERTRWGREVAGLLAEAGLPFAKTLGTTAPSSSLALRCCKGLRAKTLKQRVSCWRPSALAPPGGLPALPEGAGALLGVPGGARAGGFAHYRLLLAHGLALPRGGRRGP